jgi:hypothetical protein
MKLEPDDYAEVVGRLVSLHNLAAELAEAFDNEASRKGAEEMRASLSACSSF